MWFSKPALKSQEETSRPVILPRLSSIAVLLGMQQEEEDPSTSHARDPKNPAYNPSLRGYSEQRHLESLVMETVRAQKVAAEESDKAAQLALQAEDLARATMTQLNQQSAQMNRTEDELYEVNERIDLADKQAAHLRNLNRSIFSPVVTKRPPSDIDQAKKAKAASTLLSQPTLSEASAQVMGSLATGSSSFLTSVMSLAGAPDAKSEPPPPFPGVSSVSKTDETGKLVVAVRGASLIAEYEDEPKEAEKPASNTSAQHPAHMPIPNAAKPSSKYQPKPMVGDWASLEDRKRSVLYDATIDRNLDTISDSLRKMAEYGLVMKEASERNLEQLERIQISADQASENLSGVHERIKSELLRK